jgi:hypothetical protein
MSWASMRVASGAVLCTLALAACGGDVVVDGKPTGAAGSGGNGASSSDDDGSSSDGDDGSSDGDDGSSDGDGGPSPAGGTTGPAGATSGTGSGGSGPEACADCASNAANGPCSQLVSQCTQDEACANLLACHSGCNFELDCIQGCDASHPGGHGLLYELMGCVACGSCIPACDGQPLNNYCLLH